MLFGKLIWYQVDILEFTLYLLDHHHVWQSLDLTLDIWWNGLLDPFFLMCLFLKKRCNFILLTSLFFILKRPNFFSLESSLLHLDRNPRWSGYLCFYPPNYPADICSVIHPVIWSFPVWLSISLSYLMTVFSANLFGLFYGENFYRSDIACKELSCVRVYSEMGHLVYMYFK